MANKKIEDLKKESDIDLKIDKSQLPDESLRTPGINNKWLKKLYETRDKRFAFEQRKKDLKKENWLYYSGKADDSVYDERGPFQYKIMKSDLNLFLDSDEEMKKIETKIHIIETEISFIQKTIDEINRRSFHISNAIKALKFMNGEF